MTKNNDTNGKEMLEMNEKRMIARAKRLVALAMKAGATAAQCSVSADVTELTSARNGIVDQVVSDEGENISVYVLVGQREGSVHYGLHATGDDLSRAAEDAVAIAKSNTENPHPALAGPELWPCDPRELSRRFRALDPIDPSDPPSGKEKTRIALALDAMIRAEPGIAQTESAKIIHGRMTEAVATSLGFFGAKTGTWYRKVVGAIANGQKKGEMHSGGDWHTTVYFRDLRSDEECVKRAAMRARSLLGATPIPTKRMPVIFDQDVSAALVSAFLDAISGGAIYDKSSFLADALGTLVFRPEVSIIEDPFLPRRLASRLYDDDCVRSCRRMLVDCGVPTTWLTSIESGKKLNIPSTGHAGGVSNVWLTPGVRSRDELIASIPYGFLVTELMGHGPNIVTGDYSSGAAGFLIENGNITRPVNEVTIAANLLEMFRTLVPANDLPCDRRIAVPSCLIREMTVGGE